MFEGDVLIVSCFSEYMREGKKFFAAAGIVVEVVQSCLVKDKVNTRVKGCVGSCEGVRAFPQRWCYEGEVAESLLLGNDGKFVYSFVFQERYWLLIWDVGEDVN